MSSVYSGASSSSAFVLPKTPLHNLSYGFGGSFIDVIVSQAFTGNLNDYGIVNLGFSLTSSAGCEGL